MAVPAPGITVIVAGAGASDLLDVREMEVTLGAALLSVIVPVATPSPPVRLVGLIVNEVNASGTGEIFRVAVLLLVLYEAVITTEVSLVTSLLSTATLPSAQLELISIVWVIVIALGLLLDRLILAPPSGAPPVRETAIVTLFFPPMIEEGASVKLSSTGARTFKEASALAPPELALRVTLTSLATVFVAK